MGNNKMQQQKTQTATNKKKLHSLFSYVIFCIYFNSMCMTMQITKKKHTNNCISIVSFQLLFVTTLIKVH